SAGLGVVVAGEEQESTRCADARAKLHGTALREISFLPTTALGRGGRLHRDVGCDHVVAVWPGRSKNFEYRPRTLGAEDRPIAGMRGAADTRSARRHASCAMRCS